LDKKKKKKKKKKIQFYINLCSSKVENKN